MQDGAGGVHGQGDLDLRADFAQGGDDPAFVFAELDEAINVNDRAGKEGALTQTGQDLAEPTVGVETVLAEVGAVGFVDQMEVVKLGLEGIVVDAGRGGGLQVGQEGGQVGGGFTGAFEFGKGAVELIGQAGLVGDAGEVLEVVAVLAEQMAEDHPPALGGEFGDGRPATIAEDVPAELIEGNDARATDAFKAAGAGKLSFGHKGGLLGQQPVDGRPHGVLPHRLDDGAEAVLRFAAA